MSTMKYPKNKHIANSRIAGLYMGAIRWRIKPIARLLEWMLGTEIRCPLPRRLFMPHPYGIIVGQKVSLGENVVLMQQVTLGGKDPHLGDESSDNQYPALREGVYVGAGAKVLGPVVIGEWAIVGANAVVLRDVPAHCIAAGVPARIIKSTSVK